MPLSACCRFVITTLSILRGANLCRKTWAGCAYVVVVATFSVICSLWWGRKSAYPTVAGMYNYIQPIVSCIVTICLGMDHFNLVKGCAVVLIFVGVYLVTISRTRQELEQHERHRVGMLGRNLLPNLSSWPRWVVGFFGV